MKTVKILLFAIVLSACTDARRAKLGGYGDTFRVQLVNCDGTITHEWVSTGKVLTEEKTDGYFFNDAATGALVEVSGTLIITRISK